MCVVVFYRDGELVVLEEGEGVGPVFLGGGKLAVIKTASKGMHLLSQRLDQPNA